MSKLLCKEVTCYHHFDDHCTILSPVDWGRDEIMLNRCSLYHSKCFYCYHECNGDCNHPERYNEDYDDLEEDDDYDDYDDCEYPERYNEGDE